MMAGHNLEKLEKCLERQIDGRSGNYPEPKVLITERALGKYAQALALNAAWDDFDRFVAVMRGLGKLDVLAGIESTRAEWIGITGERTKVG